MKTILKLLLALAIALVAVQALPKKAAYQGNNVAHAAPEQTQTPEPTPTPEITPVPATPTPIPTVAPTPVPKPVVEAPKPQITGSEAEAKLWIYMHESGNKPGAINKASGACGLGQALPCSKMGCGLADYACQDAWFTNYMKSRYGSWLNAKAFWLAHSWW